MIMKTIVVAALVLLISLLITTTARAGKKKRCYKVYDKVKNSCSKAFKGRYTFEDCCAKNGAAAYGSRKRGRKKCIPCDKKTVTEASNWSQWGRWSKCNIQCGNGTVRRRRKCLNINDVGCPGKGIQKKPCVHAKVPNCPVHGGWSDFGNWTKCSTTCGKGHQLRFRSCTNPKPQYGGKHCAGIRENKRECMELPHCPIHGNWSVWGDWSACSATCGLGDKLRRRRCDNPKPKYNGTKCDPNDSLDKKSCDSFKDCDASGSGSGMCSGSGSGDCGSADGSGKDDASGSATGDEEVQAQSVKSDFDFEGDAKKPTR